MEKFSTCTIGPSDSKHLAGNAGETRPISLNSLANGGKPETRLLDVDALGRFYWRALSTPGANAGRGVAP